MSEKAWRTFLKKVNDTVNTLADAGCSDPFFRGHKNQNWKLKPALGRKKYEQDVEDRLFFRFYSLGKHLVPEDTTSWDLLFYMQHHGLPTRLLDWTETFSVALFFAVYDETSDNHDGALWILNPYKLNKKTIGAASLYSLNYLEDGYQSYFSHKAEKKFPASVLAIDGNSMSQRMRSQRGVFTIHRNLRDPLENISGDSLNKIVLPSKARIHAKHFLNLAGINEFNIYTDLDGLGSFLKREEC